MSITVSRRGFLLGGLAGLVGIASSGCGTILHPERRGQPPGPLDWSIVALDAIGLIFFIIPGIIAFAVDFGTGTIYLPPGYYGYGDPRELKNRKLEPVRLGESRLTPALVERRCLRTRGTSRAIGVCAFFSQPMSRLDEFWSLEAGFDVVEG